MKQTETNKTAETFGLIDSGAGGKFIDQNYAKWKGFEIKTLKEPITTRNVDGTENKRGKITSYVDLILTINGRTTPTRLLVSGLGKQSIYSISVSVFTGLQREYHQRINPKP